MGWCGVVVLETSETFNMAGWVKIWRGLVKRNDVVYEVCDVRRACVDVVSGSVMYRGFIRRYALVV
jgi:hypothetical protein